MGQGGSGWMDRCPPGQRGSSHQTLVWAASNHRRISARGTRPACWKTDRPPRKTTKLGIDCTPKRAATSGLSSVFTLRIKARPAISRASSWTSGAAIRQGPHHAAQKSVRMGTVASATIWEKLLPSTSSGSLSGGKGDLQEPQRPVSDRCRAGMRFPVPHVGHLRTIVNAIRVPTARATPAPSRCRDPASAGPIR